MQLAFNIASNLFKRNISCKRLAGKGEFNSVETWFNKQQQGFISKYNIVFLQGI